MPRSTRARSLRKALAASLGLLAAGTSGAAPSDRLYFKQNGRIAVALQPSGAMFCRGESMMDPASLSGLHFRKNGAAHAVINKESSADIEQLGKFSVPLRFAYQFLAVPYRPSGTLVLRQAGTGILEFDDLDGSINVRSEFSDRFQYRKNAAYLNAAEKLVFQNAYLGLNFLRYPGARGDQPLAGGVTYWFKQDEIHQATHNHGGPSFLPWHRELINRLEDHLRLEDPIASLHYWDWTQDPRDGITGDGATAQFMGASEGRIGDPWLYAGVYNPSCSLSETCRDVTGNPHDPPYEVARDVVRGSQPNILPDWRLMHDADGLPPERQWQAFREALESNHDQAHFNVGGNIRSLSNAFEDPFVFLLHANVDRLMASWQKLGPPGDEGGWCSGSPNWRMEPHCVYGDELETGGLTGILTKMEPWANIEPHTPPQIEARPWAAPESDNTYPDCTQAGLPCPGQIVRKDCLNPTVVRPRLYDYYSP